jgi:hypothetical protein
MPMLFHPELYETEFESIDVDDQVDDIRQSYLEENLQGKEKGRLKSANNSR